MAELTPDTLLRFFELAAAQIGEARDELTALDAAIGDADHGANLDRGFTAVVPRLRALEDPDLGALLRTAGSTLVSVVGGASGPLYGTALIRAGAALAERSAVGPRELAEALAAGLEGVRARGKARAGEKTMIDALEPAVEAMQAAAARGAGLCDALRAAVVAAEDGMRSTIPMVATKGRASYLGERSVGHQDPGATSTYYLLRALLRAVEEGPGAA